MIHMHVFLLGADAKDSVAIAVSKQLAALGHAVTAMTWFDTKIRQRGEGSIEYVKGTLDDPAILRRLEKADAAIDTLLPTTHAEASLDPLPPSKLRPRVVHRLLSGTGKPLVITSSYSVLGATGRTPVAEIAPVRPPHNYRWLALLEHEILAAEDIRGMVIRPAIEYGSTRLNAVTFLRSLAIRRRRGTYIEDGKNRWSTVHYEDLAELFCLAVVNPQSGLLVHGASQTYTHCELASAIHRACGFRGKPSGISIEEAQRLTPVAKALRRSHALSGEKARTTLGWRPSRPSLPDHLYDELLWYRERPRREPPDTCRA